LGKSATLHKKGRLPGPSGMIQCHTTAPGYYYFKAIWPEINNLSALYLTFLKLFVYLST